MKDTGRIIVTGAELAELTGLFISHAASLDSYSGTLLELADELAKKARELREKTYQYVEDRAREKTSE